MMKTSILEALTGIRRLNTEKVEKPFKLASDEKLDTTRGILGSTSLPVALVLCSVALSHHYTSLLSEAPREQYLEAIRGIKVKKADILTSDQGGAPLRVPSDVSLDIWPVEPEVTIRYIPGKTAFTLSGCGKEWRVHGHYFGDRLYIEWPKELGIRGALLIPDEQADVSLPILLRYPSALVVEKLKKSEEAYSLMETVQRVHEFFLSDTPDEAIGICALAVKTYTEKLNP